MPSHLSPQDRYVVLFLGRPVFTCQAALTVCATLWGQPWQGVTVLDYERPVPVPCANVRHLGALLGLEEHYTCPECLGTEASCFSR